MVRRMKQSRVQRCHWSLKMPQGLHNTSLFQLLVPTLLPHSYLLLCV